jgi:regulator of RNase E activity RraB
MSGNVVLTWMLEDEFGRVVKKELTDEEWRIPIGGIWNHAMLVERLEKGQLWSAPVQQATQSANSLLASDVKAAERESRVSVLHLLYAQTEGAARKAAAIAEGRGFEASVKRSANNIDWLICVRQRTATEDDITSAREQLETLAGELGVEYDGWEAECTDVKARDS